MAIQEFLPRYSRVGMHHIQLAISMNSMAPGYLGMYAVAPAFGRGGSSSFSKEENLQVGLLEGTPVTRVRLPACLRASRHQRPGCLPGMSI